MAIRILTIAVPAYNVEKYLDKCLTSFIVESIMDKLEVLIINDGSRDSTPDIGQKYVNKYPNTFILCNKENGGHGSAINYGIAKATAKYFKLVDGDDWLNTLELEAYIALLEELNVDIVASNFICVDDQSGRELAKKYSSSKSSFYGTERSITRDCITKPVKMHSITFRTDLLKKMSETIDEKCYYVDSEYITFPIKYADSIFFYDKFIYMYRLGRTGQSMDLNQMEKNIKMYLLVLNRLCSFYESSKLVVTPTHAKYIATSVSQVLSGIFRIYVNNGLKKDSRRKLMTIDRKIKSEQVDVYNAVENKMVWIIRKSNYLLLPVAAIIFKLIKRV